MEHNLIRFEWLPENVVIGLTGIEFAGDIPYEQWERLMSTVSHMEMAAQWAIGDALNYGASRYGEKYSQAIEVTGHSYQALANYSWVARNVPPDVRRPGLSWTHHRAVAKLDPQAQDTILRQAEAEQWTVDVLIDMTRETPVLESKKKQVEVPAGISVSEAEHILESAVCARKDGFTLCPLCPYKKDET